jgi:hypothetical protein
MFGSPTAAKPRVIELSNCVVTSLSPTFAGRVLVTRLCEGQHATVLQLPASPHGVNGELELKHAAVLG